MYDPDEGSSLCSQLQNVIPCYGCCAINYIWREEEVATMLDTKQTPNSNGKGAGRKRDILKRQTNQSWLSVWDSSWTCTQCMHPEARSKSPQYPAGSVKVDCFSGMDLSSSQKLTSKLVKKIHDMRNICFPKPSGIQAWLYAYIGTVFKFLASPPG